MMPRAPCTRHAHGYSGLLTRLPDMSGSSIRFRLISGLERTVLQFRQDLQTKLRDGVRRAIETVLEEELLAALGAAAHERLSGRRGYRHGTIERTVTTRDGTRAMTVPRARLRDQDGPPTEFRSTVLPRYARRTREVDEALLGCYFGGVNSRRIRRALRPLLGEAPLSKSAVSRVVTRVKDQFAVWQQRPLTDERYGVVFLDGLHLRVRLAGRVVMVPVLAALGVTDTGQKRLLAMQLAASEAAASWGGLLAKLQQRGLPAPLLVVTDGHAGLKKALETWPTARVQRCTAHKATQSRRRLSRACATRAAPRLPSPPLGDGRPGRPRGLRRLPEEVDPVVPTGRAVAGRSGPRAAHVLHLPEGDVEVGAHDQRVRESQSCISPTNEDPGVLQHGSRRAHRAVRPRRRGPDRLP